MKNKNYSKRNIKSNIGFNDNKIFNLTLSVGFLNLIFVFFNGLPSIKILSDFDIFLFISLYFCSFFFIFFLIKILLFDIFLNDFIDNLK
tara:strand:+ start:128 stop:394 length:267 start_codon:yes stop_codon:yes gene_type:complete